MFRVALVGAGPAAQAIHLPTLARLGGEVQVTEVMDIDAIRCQRVAANCGARATATMDDLMAGPGFDIAVIGSPDRWHAEQIERLCAGGVRGLLVEKPMATTIDETTRVLRAVRGHRVAMVVGAMHAYDPAWLAAKDAFAPTGPLHVRSSIYLPANTRFEDMATTMIRTPEVAANSVTPSEAQNLRGGVMGLAIHDLPLARHYLPHLDRVRYAALVRPWGYSITASGPDGGLELLARMPGTWRPDWAFQVFGEKTELAIEFPPSYVHAGSATATISRGPVSTVYGPYPVNGYEAEWRELLAVLGGAAPRYRLDHLSADLNYALALADMAVDALTQRDAA